MTRRFWIGFVLALPVFVLEMGGHLFRLDQLAPLKGLRLDPVAPDAGDWPKARR
jgi:hypothetical protein